MDFCNRCSKKVPESHVTYSVSTDHDILRFCGRECIINFLLSGGGQGSTEDKATRGSPPDSGAVPDTSTILAELLCALEGCRHPRGAHHPSTDSHGMNPVPRCWNCTGPGMFHEWLAPEVPDTSTNTDDYAVADEGFDYSLGLLWEQVEMLAVEVDSVRHRHLGMCPCGCGARVAYEDMLR